MTEEGKHHVAEICKHADILGSMLEHTLGHRISFIHLRLLLNDINRFKQDLHTVVSRTREFQTSEPTITPVVDLYDTGHDGT